MRSLQTSHRKKRLHTRATQKNRARLKRIRHATCRGGKPHGPPRQPGTGSPPSNSRGVARRRATGQRRSPLRLPRRGRLRSTRQFRRAARRRAMGRRRSLLRLLGRGFLRSTRQFRRAARRRAMGRQRPLLRLLGRGFLRSTRQFRRAARRRAMGRQRPLLPLLGRGRLLLIGQSAPRMLPDQPRRQH